MGSYDKRIISTTNGEFDKKLGGGIPTGSLIIAEGQSDSGKSVFIQQLLWGGLKGGLKSCLITTEDTVRSMIRQMQSLNMDIQDYFLLNHMNIVPVKAVRSKNEDNGYKGIQEILKKQKAFDFIAIDSLTSFITTSSDSATISFFEDCKYLCNEGTTLAVVAHSYAFNQSLLVRISSMCDAHLKLTLENMGDRLIKTMEVSKVRGAEKSTGNIISFDVEPGWGMKLIPFTKAKA